MFQCSIKESFTFNIIKSGGHYDDFAVTGEKQNCNYIIITIIIMSYLFLEAKT